MRDPSRRTIFLECTHVYQTDLNTGVQRVVRNILRHAMDVGAHYDVSVIPVVVQNDRLKIVSVSDNFRQPPRRRAMFALVFGHFRQFLVISFHTVVATLSDGIPIAAVRDFLEAPRSEFGLARCLLMPSSLIKAAATWILSQLDPRPITEHYVDAILQNRSDVLVLMDSSWSYPVWQACERFQASGGSIVGVIYDVIPLSHPNMFSRQVTQAFNVWLDRCLMISDGIITISRFTQTQLQAYAATMHLSKWSAASAPIRSIPLGADLDLTTAAFEPSSQLSRMFSKDQTTFIIVGSLQPHKMHAHVLAAFNLLWSWGRAVRLIIIGRCVWSADRDLRQNAAALLRHIVGHERFGSSLHYLQNASDDILDYCYSHANALIIASAVEGFGLPIVEALQMGLPVLCSDIPVFREVAGRNATFFRLDDPVYLADSINAFCAEKTTRTRELLDMCLPTWRDSTEHLFKAVLDAVGEAPMQTPPPSTIPR